MPFIIKPCAGGTVFVIKFDNLHRIDFKKVSQRIKDTNFKISIETPEVLLLKTNESEITLFKSGKILAKNIYSHKHAEEIAENLEKIIIEK